MIRKNSEVENKSNNYETRLISQDIQSKPRI